MKTIKIVSALIIASALSLNTASAAQDSLGLPGDNLDLSAVLELFKKSESPEAFEKTLNEKNSEVNNLDLNGDEKTDYIRVVDRSKDDAHALVLQVDVNEKEVQDVAVIELEKKGEGTANVQIIGDEDLYGKDYIVEPVEETVAKAAETSGVAPSAKTTVVVNVWAWPSVRYIYRPAYVVWTSPWRWHYYPTWWSPWRPVYWFHYHKRFHRHHFYHHRVHVHRHVIAHGVYAPHRSSSPYVYQHRKSVQNAGVDRSATKGGNVEKGNRSGAKMQKQKGAPKVKGTGQPKQRKSGVQKQQAPRKQGGTKAGKQGGGGRKK